MSVTVKARQFSTDCRKFEVLGIQQIAIGALDKTVLSKLWVDAFGLKKVGTYKAEVRDNWAVKQQFCFFLHSLLLSAVLVHFNNLFSIL